MVAYQNYTRMHGPGRGWTLLTLILLTWRKWWTPNNVSKWQMGFNSAFKGLISSHVSFHTFKQWNVNVIMKAAETANNNRRDCSGVCHGERHPSELSLVTSYLCPAANNSSVSQEILYVLWSLEVQSTNRSGHLTCYNMPRNINHLKPKRRPLYLKTQFVPRCKHFSSRL